MQRLNRLIKGTFLWLALAGLAVFGLSGRFGAAAGPADAPPVYYVDAAVPASGNGSSWSQAFKTIGEAAAQPLAPGSIIWVKPGTYREDIGLDQSGAQIVPMTTGVQALAGNQVIFPAGTDLSGIDLAAHPGEYYLYLARSWVSNSGVYQISAVDVANRTVTLVGASFLAESGTPDDDTTLSAAVGRPVQLRNAYPQSGYVTLDGAGTSIYTLLYVGDGWQDPCGAERPVSFITIEGLHLTNARGGLHIQDASYVLFANGRISNMSDTTGIYVDGRQQHPARYNYLIGNNIADTTGEAIYIGAGNQGAACNYTQFTHVLGNTITHTHSWMENAIEVKEHHNRGTVIAGNLIHDFTLDYYWNGAIQLQEGADDTLVYRNELRNVTPNYHQDPMYIIDIDAGGDSNDTLTRNVHVFNNLIYNTTAPNKKIYAISARGDHTEGVRIYHNTIHNVTGGVYLHYETGDGSDNDVYIENNIFDVPAGFPLITDEDWVQTGTFHLSHNFFSRTPEFYAHTTHWTGDPGFASAPTDLRLSATSAAIGKAKSVTPPLTRDFDLAARDALPDLGAFEYLPLTAPDVRGARVPAGVELRWSDVGSGVQRYEVWRSAQPYFQPGDPGSERIAADVAPMPGGEVVFTDSQSHLGDAAINDAYLVLAVRGSQISPLSNRVGEFDFGLAAGSTQR